MNKGEKRFIENEKKNKFSYLGMGISLLVCGYLLSFELSYFHYEWIAKTLAILLVMLGVHSIYRTIKYYYKGQKGPSLLFAGFMMIPSNYMLYMMFPNLFFKYSFGLAIFFSIWLVVQGGAQTLYDISKTDSNKLSKTILVVIIQVLTILTMGLQLFSAFGK